MRRYFLDTNVFLRHPLNDDPVLSPKARRILEAIEQGTIEVWTSDLVIAELVFVLSSKRAYNQRPREIADQLLPLIALPRLKLPNKRLHERAFALYTSRSIDYIDAYNVALMEQRKRHGILSFDTDFDSLAPITRYEDVQP